MPAAFVTFADNDSYSDKMDNRNGSTGTPTSDAGSRKSSEDRSKKLSVSSNASLDTLWEYYPRRLSEAGLRRHSDASQVLTEDTDSFIIGDRVWVGGTKPGQIAYIGETQFAPGEWAGIVLDEPIGKNDGSVSSVRYFQCEPRKGVFSRLTRLTRYPLESPPVIRENVALAQSTPSSLRNATAASRSKQISPTASVKTPSLSANKNLNTSNTSLASISNVDLKIGDRVIVRSSATTGSKPGILRFIGATQFAPGEWCGVELDDPIGKNDGSVDGISYFECQPFYGLFTPIHKVSKSPSTRRPSACVVHRPGSTTPGLRRSNSRESLTSMNTSIASSIRTTASRVRLGVTSLNTPKGLAKVH
ncbi:restin homolog isoform X2 [Chrysoperla carnea]|uniref:restin homolog isoform X2 n=1 Tax=Chrysoperla carnea TaxID=189513 RepID=UPI001D0983D3|nr:restin homolog isoform X2 [Chrysoperla carnea]